MLELTIGNIAGLIALGIFFIRIWTPNTIVFILAGLLGHRNTAKTWSVAGRVLQGSHWPDVLRVETASSHASRKDITMLLHLDTLTKLLIVVAGVITPLGLYEATAPAKPSVVPFVYLKDSGPFGMSTSPRSGYPWARKCETGRGWLPGVCPYSKTFITYNGTGTRNETLSLPYGYDTGVPQIVRDIYSSGTAGVATTVSNFFDIESRQYRLPHGTKGTINEVNNGTEFLVESGRKIKNILMNDAIEPIEGLIVDTKTGGIGFRNHTVPVEAIERGATWQEDILFVVPETSCVNTNLSVEFAISSTVQDSQKLVDISLVDHGGFSNVTQEYPYYDRNNSQLNPDLLGRAYKAAWLSNVYTMAMLNVTNTKTETLPAFSYLKSKYGQKFPLKKFPASREATSIFEISNQFGTYADYTNGSNPFDITSREFTDIRLLCEGAGSEDIANITNILLGCSRMTGIPIAITDTSNPFDFSSGSRWRAPMYTCASAVKAIVKTVHFKYNGTNGLQSLSITDVEDKYYKDKAQLPMWGVEDSGRTLTDIRPVWGLISKSYEKHANISSVRKRELWLPGYKTFGSSSEYYVDTDYMPGSTFATRALAGAIGQDSALYATFYSGATNLELYLKWRELSRTSEDAGKILNLIWTDYAASMVASSKGTLGHGNLGASRDTVGISVTPYLRQIRYNYLYAIPALVLLLLMLVIACLAMATLVSGRSDIATVRTQLQHSSTGRILATFLEPERSDMSVGPKTWDKNAGKLDIDLCGKYPVASNNVVQIEQIAHPPEPKY